NEEILMSGNASVKINEPATTDDAWRPAPETAPSVMQADEPLFIRLVGFVGLLALTAGGVALLLQFFGWRSILGKELATFFCILGLVSLLLHAVAETDLHIRRAFGMLGFAWLVTALVTAAVPVDLRVGALFLQFSVPCFILGLLFLM